MNNVYIMTTNECISILCNLLWKIDLANIVRSVITPVSLNRVREFSTKVRLMIKKRVVNAISREM